MGQFGLADWEETADRRDWPILLHGNGASCAVSHRFAYPSLYRAAPLTADDRDIFSALRTTNFEEVLDHLRTAALICDQVGHDPHDVHNRYDSVREALIEAVNLHHADWVDLDGGGRLRRLSRALRPYDEVYTTCYDLLIYWAMMSRKPPGAGYVDFFWNVGLSFDPLKTSVHANRTAVYFLHGALHLYRGPNGVTKKRSSRSGNLLAQIATASRSPLFVSEGTAQQKLRSIRRSDYLSFAYENFGMSEDNMVIFGQSLSRQDAHLVRVLKAGGRRRIAYGVYADTQNQADLQRATIRESLPQARLTFFDSRTHPLGHPALYVP